MMAETNARVHVSPTIIAEIWAAFLRIQLIFSLVKLRFFRADRSAITYPLAHIKVTVTGCVCVCVSAIRADMVEFLEQNKGGNLAAWTRTSVWSRDTGGERDRSGAPKRAQVPAHIATIFTSQFQPANTHLLFD